MRNTLLDRPIWSALATVHAALGEGAGLARRYRPGLLAFAGTEMDTPEAMADFAALVRPGETLYFLQADPVPPAAGFEVLVAAEAVQMVAQNVPAAVPDEAIVALGEGDAEEMMTLATLTKPGPFSLKSQELGRFWGVREGGRIVAMAGERMKQPGYTELSGVCTHPDHRGKGHARRLSLHVAARILEAGAQPYLHAYASNTAAIGLYEAIGFSQRRSMHVAALRRPD
ncbi:GNAT family N-acetyltransferase [Shinella sp. CPCC 101442]|uniref:GNAT family N-acetyltransferase n=1 Tax=Shinella sp. CPCC 101442 TaxID=2932265 RepID=UPI002153A269|nr:GNAT family N-acetyltransferase [Shinella sp. CPCC 101442]MCR6500388.1 GNAT family N-acetyltransferase [Shinella sp. CPCC 101442]